MTCETCAHWCAITQKQLDGRLKNMAETPGGQPHPCPQCHGIDWATTRAMIKDELPKRWWQWRPKEPPSWRTIRMVNVVGAIVCIGVAVTQEEKWIAIADGVIGGFNIAGIFHATAMIRMRAVFDSMHQAFDQMAELNGALIQDKVHFILRQAPDDDSPPISPRLH